VRKSAIKETLFCKKRRYSAKRDAILQKEAYDLIDPTDARDYAHLDYAHLLQSGSNSRKSVRYSIDYIFNMPIRLTFQTN